MSILFYLIGAIMISIAVGNMYSATIGFIALGSFLIFVALFDEVMEYLNNR